MSLHSDQAFDFLIAHLAAIPEFKGSHAGSARTHTYGCDLWIPMATLAYWRQREPQQHRSNPTAEECQPFYDAAWELCRIGVLRPGEAAPIGMGGSLMGFNGDGYSLTAFGRKWLQRAAERPHTDPSRLAEVLGGFALKFGEGYAQRATEAVSTYRTANYLAACVMAGAAAESILLAVAIALEKDETKLLAEYNISGGRRRLTGKVVSRVPVGIGSQFQTALQVLHYWRDDAAHGSATAISEIEAFASLTQLLRLAQFASDHWAKLTALRT